MSINETVRTTPSLSERLADFPWDQIATHRERASRHPEGLVDLSMGSPVDATPRIVRDALCSAADAPSYPTTAGVDELRQAIAGWFDRRCDVRSLTADTVLPLVGTKELLTWLPTLLDVPRGSAVAVPALAYPSYVAAINLAGVQTVFAEDPTTIAEQVDVRICYINYPNNPTGEVADAEHLRRVVAWARRRGVVLISDECYSEFAWSKRHLSVLHPDVCEGSHENLLVVNSLSKRSNMAGYRSGFFAGDRALVKRLLEIRKHLGVAVPTPIQAASIAALNDDAHVDAQRDRYIRRRDLLTDALRAAGWNVPECEGGLYLWIDRAGFSSWDTVSVLAENGILATPGDFYGPAGRKHVRVALTALDDQVDMAAKRLQALA